MSIKSKVLAAAALAVAAVTVPALPALASATFAVTDNGGVLVTRQALTVRQVFHCAGVAYTVEAVKGSYGSYAIAVTPRFPVADVGRVVPCST